MDTGLSANPFGLFYCIEVLYVPKGSQPSSKKLSNPKELTPLSLNMEEKFVSSQVSVPTGKIWSWLLLWPPGSTERPPSPIPALLSCFLPLQAHVALLVGASTPMSCLPTMCSTPQDGAAPSSPDLSSPLLSRKSLDSWHRPCLEWPLWHPLLHSTPALPFLQSAVPETFSLTSCGPSQVRPMASLYT